MKLFAKTALLALALMFVGSASALAQDAVAPAAAPAVVDNSAGLAGVGCGLVIIGCGVGIGLLTYSAVAGMARQPEMAGNIQTAMIISAALIEGVTFFALIVIGFIL